MTYEKKDPRSKLCMLQVVESIHEFTFRGNDIRVWRTEENVRKAAEANYRDILAALKKENPKTIDEAAEVIHRCPRVSAYQIATSNGRGIVVYTDWP